MKELKEYERIERLGLYFTANDIDNEEKRKAILLTSHGIECYHLFKGLTTPRKLHLENQLIKHSLNLLL